jgi:hypothetical protein
MLTDSPGQVKSTIHPPIHNYPSRFLNPLPLDFGLRLVILRQHHQLATPTERRPGIARVGHPVILIIEDEHIGSAPGMPAQLILKPAIPPILALSVLHQLLAACREQNELVHFSEVLLQRC